MKSSAVLALMLVFAAMFGAVEVSRSTFEHLPHLEDEFAYLFQARIFQHGDTFIETPQPERPYWQPFLVNLNEKRFSKYPPGWSLLLAIGTGMNLPWVVNVWFAGLIVALVYRFGRELYDRTAGITAAVLMTISPIALILNGSLMGHTSTLFFTTLFVYGLWRVERERRKPRLWMWAALSGASLGMLITSRPLVAVAVAVPFIIYCGLRLLLTRRELFLPALKPLIVLILFTLLYAAPLPAYNYVVSGNATTNLYTYIWSYDQVGFGPGHGRLGGATVFNLKQSGIKIHMKTFAGHTVEKGWETVRRDGKCYFRDLFGWTVQPDNPPVLIDAFNDCLVDRRGLSWILLPFALAFMIRRNWSILLLTMAASVILIYIAYWVGTGIYSARYYFEATSALALVSGAGLSGLAQQADKMHMRYAVYGLFAIAVLMSLVGYTPKRLEPLQGYGRITRELIDEVERLRQSPDIPVLVIASGEHHWRDVAPLMSLTDPYTRNDVIALRDADQQYADLLMQRYPDRQVIFLIDHRLFPINTPVRDPSP